MEAYKELTAQDYINAKTSSDAFEKVYRANVGLIGVAFKNIHRYSYISDSVYELVLLEGFYSAVMAYEPDKGLFSTYAVKSMKNAVSNFNRKHGLKEGNTDEVLRRTDTLSLDMIVHKGDTSGNDELSTLGEFISDGTHEEYEREMREEKLDIDRILSFLPLKDAVIIRALGEGETLVSLAKEMGCSHQNIMAISKRSRQRLKFIRNEALKVASLSKMGFTKPMIAEKLGYTQKGRVSYFLSVYEYLYNNGEKPLYMSKYLNFLSGDNNRVSIAEERE